ncbi:MAG: ECF-type sigma factor [Pirellulales bacterium]|nr:ECF-type sigma factor [Pirellulales bacterium]
MTQSTQLFEDFDPQDPQATQRLLESLYDELRALAASKLAHERPGQTLEATALVHEAYLRLSKANSSAPWQNRAHFLGAIAETMRRILVDNARRKLALKHGGEYQRAATELDQLHSPLPDQEILEVHAALEELQRHHSLAANLVKLRYFGGLTIPQIACELDISPRKADQIWAYARAWLAAEIRDTPQKS